MGTKIKVNRSECGARTINGICIPMGIPCTSVGDSICSPVRDAFALGVNSVELKNDGKMIHTFGVCPFCHGTPVIKKSNWFKRILLRQGPSVVCSKCAAELISVNEIFTGEEIVIHLPE